MKKLWPITEKVLNFTHKLHVITQRKNLTMAAVCLWDQDFSTASICQQSVSFVLHHKRDSPARCHKLLLLRQPLTGTTAPLLVRTNGATMFRNLCRLICGGPQAPSITSLPRFMCGKTLTHPDGANSAECCILHVSNSCAAC